MRSKSKPNSNTHSIGGSHWPPTQAMSRQAEYSVRNPGLDGSDVPKEESLPETYRFMEENGEVMGNNGRREYEGINLNRVAEAPNHQIQYATDNMNTGGQNERNFSVPRHSSNERSTITRVSSQKVGIGPSTITLGAVGNQASSNVSDFNQIAPDKRTYSLERPNFTGVATS